MPLPFLIVHGDGLWKVLLVVLVASAIGVTQLGRRIAAARRARRATRMLDRDHSASVIRGTLGGGTIATVTFATSAALDKCVLHHRADELWIDTPEGRVALVGDVEVVSGARASGSRNGVPKRTPEQLCANPLAHRRRLWNPAIATATLLELAPGDRVVARGALVRTAGMQATDYRENATTSSLNASEGVPIQVAALSPRGAVGRLSVFTLVVLGAATGVFGYTIERGLGEKWREQCDSLGTHIVLDNMQACVLAGTMPDQLGVLGVLSARFDWGVDSKRIPIASEAALDERVALVRFLGGCRRSLDYLRGFAQPDLLLAEATSCHDFPTQQLALTWLGRFDEAARLGPLTHSGTLPVLAGDWAGAAHLAEWHARTVSNSDSNGDAETREADVLHWRCIAELMRWNAGDRAAITRLRALIMGTSACRAELVEMSTGANRDDLLASRDAPWPRDADESNAFDLQHVLAGEHAISPFSADAIGPTLAEGAAHLAPNAWMIWGAMLSSEPPHDPTMMLPQSEFAYFGLRLVAHVYDGDLAAAHRDADRAIEIASSVDRARRRSLGGSRYLGVIHALIDLYGPVTNTPFTDTDPSDVSLDGRLVSNELPPIYARHSIKSDTESHGLRMPAGGDGEQVAAEMLHSSWTDMDVLAVLPHVTAHRDDVLHAFKWSSSGSAPMDFDAPWTSIAFAAERRAIFEIFGDREAAARWAVIYARYRAAVTDRRTLIALLLWGRS